MKANVLHFLAQLYDGCRMDFVNGGPIKNVSIELKEGEKR